MNVWSKGKRVKLDIRKLVPYLLFDDYKQKVTMNRAKNISEVNIMIIFPPPTVGPFRSLDGKKLAITGDGRPT